VSLDSPDRDRRYVTRILELDGVFHLVVARGPWCLCARRLTDAERACAIRQLDDTHAELEAVFAGPGGGVP
jgi:hypothetical protein